MAESKHTPGPWEIIGGNIYASCPSILRDADKIPDGMRKSGDALVVARVHAPERFRDGNALATVDANARLIAAAPDMLAALKLVMQHGRIDDSESRTNAVAAAISKAESR